MLPQAALKYSSIDMTLALGADSFLHERDQDCPGVDPTGESCLVNLIDLAVNSDVCFLLLPSQDTSSTDAESESMNVLADLVESLESAARSAKIPRQRLRPLPLGIEAVGFSIEKVLDELRLGTVHTVIEMLPATKMLDA